jgi:hypothetical protein
MMELEFQFDIFLDSLSLFRNFPSLSLKADRLFSRITISYFSCAQGALVATRAVSCLSSTYPFLLHGFAPSHSQGRSKSAPPIILSNGLKRTASQVLTAYRVDSVYNKDVARIAS